MKIGGEFEFIPYSLVADKNLFDDIKNRFPNVDYFFSGRSALFHVLRHIIQSNRKIKRIFLPGYVCYAVYFPVKKALEGTRVEIVFYEQNDRLESSITDDVENSVVFIVDYFGKTDLPLIHKIKALKQNAQNIVIIKDITHRLITEEYDTEIDWVICSLRKWLFLTDGAFIAGRSQEIEEPLNLPDKNFILARLVAAQLKLLNVKYNPQVFADDYYLAIYRFCENELEKQVEGVQISQSSLANLKKVDFESLVERRKQNRDLLIERFRIVNDFTVLHSQSLFGVPVLFTNPIARDHFRKRMMDYNIYLPVHWPMDWQQNVGINQLTYRMNQNISARILSFVIDQRYNADDMAFMIHTTQQVLEER